MFYYGYDKSYALNNNYHEIAPEESIIWGPGLKPEEIVMKARYIFLQLRDSNGMK